MTAILNFMSDSTTLLNQYYDTDWFMVFNASFNNILDIWWRSVLLVEETGIPRENHRPVANHWQTLSHNVVSSTHPHEQGSNSQLWCTGSCNPTTIWSWPQLPLYGTESTGLVYGQNHKDVPWVSKQLNYHND